MKFKYTYIMLLCFCSMQGQVADKVITNAKVYTADASDTFVASIAVKDGLILYTGTNEGVQKFIDNTTEVLDAGNRLVLPGFHDVHMHPLEVSSINGGACVLNGFVQNPENYITTLENCNASPNSNGWIVGFGHSIFSLLEATRSPKEILDEVFPNTATIIMEETSHSVWINSLGLQVLGITASTPDPVGGHIVKSFWGDNDPDGILLDNAGDDALAIALGTNSTLEQNNYDGLVSFGLPIIARNGITSICEGRTYWKQNYIETWEQLKNNDELTCRVNLAPWVYPSDDDAIQIPQLQSFYDEGDDILKIKQIKLYSDGIIINATAALEEPYDNNLGFPFDTGLNYINETRLTNLITQLELVGYDFHIHAIGDRGVTEALNAIESARNTNGDVGARHRITHLELVNPLDYPRFNELNVIADIQVAGDFTNPENWSDNEFFIGPERSENFIPLKSLYENDAFITLSSDWDVSALKPFVGIENALTRSPQELPDVATAVKSYTINGAFVMRQEQQTGSIEVGKFADLIIVDRDIFTIPQGQISQTNVLLTWLAGEEVYVDPLLSTSDEAFTNKLPLTYPSQTSTNINVYFKTEDPSPTMIHIYTITGKEVLSKQIVFSESANFEVTIGVSTMAEGVYILEIPFPNKKTYSSKFIVSR